jgi:hypothetical protein
VLHFRTYLGKPAGSGHIAVLLQYLGSLIPWIFQFERQKLLHRDLGLRTRYCTHRNEQYLKASLMRKKVKINVLISNKHLDQTKNNNHENTMGVVTKVHVSESFD